MANTAPLLTGVTSVTFAENTVNATPQLLDTNVIFTDPDNNFNGGTLKVSGLLTEDSVTIRNQGMGAGEIGFSSGTAFYEGVAIGSASGGTSGTSLSVTFNASATSVAIDALIENLTYANSSDTPTAARTLMLTVTDTAGAATLDLTNWSFTEVTGAANPFNGIDVGDGSAPTLADVDGDGDIDAVVASLDGFIIYYQNTGSATAPVYVQQTGPANPFDGIRILSAIPQLADVDGDGDLDAVIGDILGTLSYFQNTGSATVPVYALQTGAANPFSGFNVVFDAAPALADVDGDGDLDAVVGNQDGNLFYLQNTGNATAPIYALQTGAANPFNGIDLGRNTAPRLADVMATAISMLWSGSLMATSTIT